MDDQSNLIAQRPEEYRTIVSITGQALPVVFYDVIKIKGGVHDGGTCERLIFCQLRKDQKVGNNSYEVMRGNNSTEITSVVTVVNGRELSYVKKRFGILTPVYAQATDINLISVGAYTGNILEPTSMDPQSAGCTNLATLMQPLIEVVSDISVIEQLRRASGKTPDIKLEDMVKGSIAEEVREGNQQVYRLKFLLTSAIVSPHHDAVIYQL